MDSQFQVTRQCTLNFSITSKFIDEVVLYVVPLDICKIVLGSPYLYDWKYVFYCEENKCRIFKGRVEYVVRSHRMKKTIYLLSARQMKILVNSSKSFVLIVIKPKEKYAFDALEVVIQAIHMNYLTSSWSWWGISGTWCVYSQEGDWTWYLFAAGFSSS